MKHIDCSSISCLLKVLLPGYDYDAVPVPLFSITTVLHFCFSTFRSTFAVPSLVLRLVLPRYVAQVFSE